jgi:hypothetical protein
MIDTCGPTPTGVNDLQRVEKFYHHDPETTWSETVEQRYCEMIGISHALRAAMIEAYSTCMMKENTSLRQGMTIALVHR